MTDPIKLTFRPGIDREATNYATTGGWYDGNMIRWRSQTAESMGGWVRYTSTAMLGTARSLFPFSTLSGTVYYGCGTNLKYYLLSTVTPNDITPIRASSTINNNPFAIASSSAVCTVTDTAHGAVVNDFVTYSGATTIGASNVTAAVLNREYQITQIVDANTYKIKLTVTSDTTSAGGGGAGVTAEYQINVGLDTNATGNGFGSGVWGGGTTVGWGNGSSSYVNTDHLRLWSEDNWGENLLMCVRDGAIYYKDISAGVSTRATALTAYSGASNTPTVARQVFVSDNDRHAVAVGCNPLGSSTQDRQLIRWSDTENLAQWTPNTTNSAGSLRIDVGSEILRAIETTNETLMFTDVSIHSFKYIGAPYTFGQVTVALNIHLIGPYAAISNGAQTYWMANGVFQMYDGVVHDIPCDVRTYIFDILNFDQTEKITSGVNRQFKEVIWLIPVNGSTELNFYVICNYEDPGKLLWYYGNFNGAGRTTWLDAWYEDGPLSTGTDGYVYIHEEGDTDGSVTPPTRLQSYLTSAVFEMANGGDFMLVSRIIPDISFDNSSAASPQVTMSFNLRDYPGSAFGTGPSDTVTRTVSTPVERYTTKIDSRFRARSTDFTVAATATGTSWSLGTPRLFASPDGKRG